MANDLTRSIKALDDLLDRERAALIDGDLDRVAGWTERKAVLMTEIGKADIGERSDLDRLRDKVNRNQALLGCALEGIRAVADRMAELRHVRQGLDTYDRSGRKTWIGIRDRAGLEKRA